LRCSTRRGLAAERSLLHSYRRLASFANPALRALCLAARPMELSLRLVKFTPEPLQLTLETAKLTLDHLDPVECRFVCVCRDRY
jgi:hypothetical protein